MSIFSSIGSALSSAYNSVKNTVSSIGSSLFGGGSSNTASALQAVTTPQGNQVIANRASGTASAAPKATSTIGNTTYYNNAPIPTAFTSAALTGKPITVSAPVSTPAGTKTSSNPSLSNPSTGSSNYSSPSYSVNNALLSSQSLAPQSAPAVSTTVSSGTIGAGTPSIVMPSAPTAKNYANQAIAGNIAVGGDTSSGLIKPAVQVDANGIPITAADRQDAETRARQQKMQELLAPYVQPASEADLYQKAMQQSGLQAAQQQRANTQNAINAVTSKMNADLLQLRGTAAKEGVTEAVYGGQQAEVTREATIRLLPLQAQLAADQGNLELAQQNTDTLFKIYSDDAKASADFYNKQADRIYDILKTEDQRKVDDLVWQKNYNAKTVAEDAQYQRDVAQKLLESGNMAGYKAVTAIQPPVNVNSPSFAEDYQNYKSDLNAAVSQYGSSIGQAQRQTQQLQLQKLSYETQKAKIDASQAAQQLPGPVQTRVQQVAGQFDAEQAVKNYQTIAETAQAVKTAGSSPTDDIQRIYAIAKVLDPNSAVREGEYKTVQDYAQSLIQRSSKNIQRVFDNSGFLTPQARSFINTTLDNRMAAAKKAYDNVYSEYGRRIDKITGRSDGTDYITDYSAAFKSSAPKDSGQQQYDPNAYRSKYGY